VNTINILKSIAKAVITAVLFVPFLVGLELSTVGIQEAVAQKGDAPKRKTRRVESIRQKHMKTFEKVNLAFEEKKMAELTTLLDKLEKDPDLNNIERAYVFNYRGNVCFDRDNLNCALTNFKKLVNIKEGVPESFQNQILYVIAQVLFSQEKFREALQYAQRWFKTQEDPTADAYALIGQAHYMLKEYTPALENTQTAITKYEAIGTAPKEPWLQILSQAYREKKQYKKMLPVLKQLVQYYPKKSYLLTMASVYNELDDQPKMTAMYQAMYDQGLLQSESEVVALAQLNMTQDNPYGASQVMQKGIKAGLVKSNLKNYRIYSQALFAAREYKEALGPLEKAASLAKDGKLYNQLGLSLIQLNQWGDAEGALRKAINKGKLTNAGSTYISLGLAQFEQKKFKAAEGTFGTATRYEKVASDARSWINYVQAEVRRIAELEAPIPEIDTSVEPLT